MISAKEGRKPTGFLRWPGASEEDFTPGTSDQSIMPIQVMIEEVNTKGNSTAPSHQDHNKAPSGHQLQWAEGGRSFGGRYGDQPRRLYCLFCGEDKGHTTRTCQVTIQKQKEIAEAEARQNQSKHVLHTASCYSPYIPEYVGNQQPMASAASASHSQASWAQLPPPPPLPPTLTRSQQPKGHQHAQQQGDFREESEACTVNSTVSESKHIY
jgi:hypothetical protein